MHYIVIYILQYIVKLNYTVDKKSELTSFRTTEGNMNYLKQLAESHERSVAFILNKMIQKCRERGVFDISQI